MLGALAVWLACRHARFRASWLDELLLWLPPLLILTLISSQTGLGMFSGVRYVLPAFPFLLISISRVGRVFDANHPFAKSLARCIPARIAASQQSNTSAEQRGNRFQHVVGSAAAVIVLVGLITNIIAVVGIHPHHLSYFNATIGGPRNGWRHVIDSNLDWGQDLLLLRRWLKQHPHARPLYLACTAGVDPRVLGIDYPLAPPGPAGDGSPRQRIPELLGPQPGWFAVSVSLRAHRRLETFDANGKWVYFAHDAFNYFDSFEPVDRVGHSIAIYHITLDEANRVRGELNLPRIGRDGG